MKTALLILSLAACTDIETTDEQEQEITSSYVQRALAAGANSTALAGVVRDSAASVGRPIAGSKVDVHQSRKNTVMGAPSGGSYMVFVAKPFTAAKTVYPAGLYEMTSHADASPVLYFWSATGRTELSWVKPPPNPLPSPSDPFGVCRGVTSQDSPAFRSKCLGFHVCAVYEEWCGID